jgi:diguanylate cyclase (GGDEF)-like protein
MTADNFEALLGKNCASPPDDGFEMAEMDTVPAVSSDTPEDHECWMLDGRVLSMRRTAMPDGGFVKTFTDVTDRKKSEEVIRRMAHHDHLTGLANRARFSQEIEHAVTGSRRSDARLALAMIDLDKFKPVNDRFGHLVGDKLLAAIADVLKSHIRDGDLAARFGGDEFAVLLTNVESVDHAVTIARRICEALSAPITIDGHVLEIGASIGIALYPDHAATATNLISAADDALYSVKDSGRGDVAVSKIRSFESHRASTQKAG